MGTYTTNKNLFMPSVGETGWGTLVNGNFSTIDTYLKPISLSGSTYTFTGNQTGGSISATSISNSGTLTQTGTSTFTGKITANGGIGTTSLTTSSTITSTGKITGNGGIAGALAGNVTGNVTGFLFIKGTIGTSGNEDYATLANQSVTLSSNINSPTSITVNNYSIVYGNPKRHTWGVYTRRSDLTGTTNPSVSTRTLKFNFYAPTNGTINGGSSNVLFYYKKSTESNYTSKNVNVTHNSGSNGAFLSTILSISVTPGETYMFYMRASTTPIKAEIDAGTTYKVKYATP